MPNKINLIQNYPNPFNPTTTIEFSLPKTTKVNLSVFDVTGKMVANLVNEEKTPGTYSIMFNGSQLTSGIYFYKLETGTKIYSKK